MSRRRHGRRGGPPQGQATPVPLASQQQQEGDGFLEKLGVRPGMTICLMNPPEGFYSRISNGIPSTCRLYLGLPPKPPAHMFLLWPDGTRQNLETSLQYLKPMLSPEGGIWVAVSKKSGGRSARPSQNGPQGLTFEDVQQAGLATGLVDNKQLSFSDTHYGLRFVVRRADRGEVGPPPRMQGSEPGAGPPGRPPAGAEQR